MSKTDAQVRASLRWEAAYERLHNVLSPHARAPPPQPADLLEALALVEKGLAALRAAFVVPSEEGQDDPDKPMHG